MHRMRACAPRLLVLGEERLLGLLGGRPVDKPGFARGEAAWVEGERLLVRELELVLAVGEDEDVGRRVEPHRVVVLPINGGLGLRQRAEVRLVDERLDEMHVERPAVLGRANGEMERV